MVQFVTGWQRIFSTALTRRCCTPAVRPHHLSQARKMYSQACLLHGQHDNRLRQCQHFKSTSSNASCSELEVRRTWCHETDPDSKELVVRVGSFNLLAQHQIEKNIHLYQHCREEDLDWSLRKQRLMREISDISCDILCLQEVQVDHFEDVLKPFLESLGYQCYFKSKTRKCYDGCAIAYKRSKFVLEQVELVEFYRPTFGTLQADNVGIVMRLLPIGHNLPSVRPLCFANTHLYFNPNRGDIKLAQLILLLATIDQVARCKPGSGHVHYPVILCGDLNAEPTSHLLDFLTSGFLKDFCLLRKSDISDQNLSSFYGQPTNLFLKPTDLPPPGVNRDCQIDDQYSEDDLGENVRPHIRHLMNFSSVYFNAKRKNLALNLKETRATRHVTSFTAHGFCNVDHMLFTADTMRLLGYCQTILHEEFTRVGGIPNGFHGSDHIPLYADFALRHEFREQTT